MREDKIKNYYIYKHKFRQRRLEFYLLERCKDKLLRDAVYGLLKLKDFKKSFNSNK